jgi:hypothetical protein
MDLPAEKSNSQAGAAVTSTAPAGAKASSQTAEAMILVRFTFLVVGQWLP